MREPVKLVHGNMKVKNAQIGTHYHYHYEKQPWWANELPVFLMMAGSMILGWLISQVLL